MTKQSNLMVPRSLDQSNSAGWYTRSQAVAKASLYNCSADHDLTPAAHEKITSGTIVLGGKGWAVAEAPVFGMTARETSGFSPTRRVEWEGFELDAMVHPNLPAGTPPKSKLRPYNYAVAALVTEQQRRRAHDLALSIIVQADGSELINVEIACFRGQGTARRAKLV